MIHPITKDAVVASCLKCRRQSTMRRAGRRYVSQQHALLGKGGCCYCKSSTILTDMLKTSPLMLLKFLLSLVVGIQLHARLPVSGLEVCPLEQGGGICPDGNTCCQTVDGSSGCIPSDMGKHSATCCPDGETGCPMGYMCDASDRICVLVNATKYTDPLVEVLPRYRLCNAAGIENVYGLFIDEEASLAYYSSHGPIESLTLKDPNEPAAVDLALIMIHGADRNGDDYFCTAKSIAKVQHKFSNVLVIAPQFYSETDDRATQSLLFWNGENKDGTWRYGADSMGPRQVSSFTALDLLVETIVSKIPSLKRVVVAGHSSGGQTVQRWSLLTSTWLERPTMVAVVANPSSYAYLSPLRIVNGIWAIPADCPQYDQWEWGLSTGGDTEVPYRNRALQNSTRVIERFQERRIIYLAGGQDRCNVSGSGGWCNSHGLETTCMDDVQGDNRLVRSARYVSSLRTLGFGDSHERHIVGDVGHDHAMIFQSSVGLAALFGGLEETDTEVLATGGND